MNNTSEEMAYLNYGDFSALSAEKKLQFLIYVR